eukprot:361100-Chlamydomonas_euryale.AAC.4
MRRPTKPCPNICCNPCPHTSCNRRRVLRILVGRHTDQTDITDCVAAPGGSRLTGVRRCAATTGSAGRTAPFGPPAGEPSVRFSRRLRLTNHACKARRIMHVMPTLWPSPAPAPPPTAPTTSTSHHARCMCMQHAHATYLDLLLGQVNPRP